MAGTTESRGVAISYGVYRALLGAYPAAFRRQYRADMARLFRDTCREAHRRRGTCGLIPVWGRALLDLSVNAPKEGVMLLLSYRRMKRLSRSCSLCGSEIEPTWKTCRCCGYLLTPAMTHETPRHVAEPPRDAGRVWGAFAFDLFLAKESPR